MDEKNKKIKAKTICSERVGQDWGGLYKGSQHNNKQYTKAYAIMWVDNPRWRSDTFP